ncbi:Uncharacterised protein [Vibrio cholerae]|nr:Uncharacterised protein [Vibrio cholerae]CSC65821.1 Uncharacterised protein [Vibrio cholerae]
MACSDTDISNPHQSIWTRGVHFKIGVFTFNGKFQFHTFRAANPVALHGFDHFRPTV